MHPFIIDKKLKIIAMRISLIPSYQDLKDMYHGFPVIKVGCEAALICAASACLKLGVWVLYSSLKEHKLAYRIVDANTAYMPRYEEIRFRLLIPGGIWVSERLWNKFVYKDKPSERALFIQKTIRIWISAALFGVVHTSLGKYFPLASANTIEIEKSFRSNLLSFTWTFVAGLNYGYLSEKYHTISLGILAHGLNNFIGQSVALEYISTKAAIGGVATIQVALAIINFGKG